MANEEQLKILLRGSDVWNEWKWKNPTDLIDLSGADLREVYLVGLDLSGVNLSRADLREAVLMRENPSGTWAVAYLVGADLSGANLTKANLTGAELAGADLSGANLLQAILIGADLTGAYLLGAKLAGADLSGANLIGASLSDTVLERANLTGCKIYGVSAWNLKIKEAKQKDLVITTEGEPIITVDNIEVAQFIYLLLHNEKIRHVIDTITSKVVLILGRFTPERKAVLDALRDELRRRNYSPVLFDFEKSESRDVAETVSTLAHMARFIIADITDAKSIPAELEHIVPPLPLVPVQPLILKSQYEYALFEHIMMYRSVLDLYRYENQEDLLSSLKARVIDPAEEKAKKLAEKLDKIRSGDIKVLD